MTQSKRRRDRVLWIEHAGFSIIVLLSWLTELVHLPHLIFDEPFSPNWHRAGLRTIVVGVIWICVHRETRRLLQRLHHLEEFLLVCSWCRKVGDEGRWLSMEHYFGDNFATRTTHGICPECEAKMFPGSADPRSRQRPPAAFVLPRPGAAVSAAYEDSGGLGGPR